MYNYNSIMAKVLLSVICIIAILSCVNAAAAPKVPVQTFVIDSGSKDTKTVHLIGEAVSTSCEFKYDTSVQDTSSKKKDYTPAATLLAQMSKKYGCLQYNHDIFKYQVCLGDEITQSANEEKYSLGKYEKSTEGHSSNQLFTKGSFCEVAHTDRKTIVEFACADKASVQSISEHAVCQYKIIVGVPEVCGHPQFVPTSSAKEEAWVLEISETDEGAVICQAYNNGYDAMSSVKFSVFSLSITTEDYALVKHVVREKNRKDVSTSVLQKSSSPAGISIRSPQQVDYAKIVAE